MPERPLVALDALLVAPGMTGVGRSIIELTSALGAVDRGFDFAVLAAHSDQFAHVAGLPGWRVVDCPGARGGSWRKALHTQLRLPGLLRELGVGLLHSLQFVAPLLWRGPLVTTVHDLSFLSHPGTVEQPRRAYYRLLVPPSLHRSAAVVVNSRATGAEVARWYPSVAGKVAVTPFGTPSWALQMAAEGPPAAPGEGPFLFVGTLEPRKNLARLLDAYRLFLERAPATAGPPPDLVLAGGKGWADAALEGPIRALQARGKLVLAGYCQPRRLWELYRSARALLFPSLHEGFGFPILEAMAAGLPVLTADRGAMKEVAGDAALLVDPEDVDAIASAMARLHAQPDLRGTLRERGWRRVKTWSWDRAAEATAGVYRQILDQARPPAAENIVVAPGAID